MDRQCILSAEDTVKVMEAQGITFVVGPRFRLDAWDRQMIRDAHSGVLHALLNEARGELPEILPMPVGDRKQMRVKLHDGGKSQLRYVEDDE